jgi:hypothetical protein
MARYQSVNGEWPEGTNDGRDLKPTPQEALSAAKRLYRFAMKKPFRGKVVLTSGRRDTLIRRHVMYVNPDRKSWFDKGGGWHEIVHGLSHYCAYRLYPGSKPHDSRHAFLEREMIKHVVSSGWLEGKLRRPEKPKAKVDLKEVRRKRIEKRLVEWAAKRKRAETALKKLRRQARYYEQQMTDAV